MQENNTQITPIQLNQKVDGLKQMVLSTEIKTDEDIASVSDKIKGIKTFEKLVNAEMAKIIDPLKQVIDDTKVKYDPYLKSCINAEAALKAKATLYLEAKEAERKKAETKIVNDLASGKIKKEETAIAKLEKLPEQVKTTKTENSSLQMKKIPGMEIVDEKLIPDEYWVVDMVKLKKVVVAGVEVPGTKLIYTTSLASR